MSDTDMQPRKAGPRDVYFFTHPAEWPVWPFLPVVRYRADGEMDVGVVYDCCGVNGRMGLSATVFLTNVIFMPETEEAFLALPKESFDTPEEMAAAGWCVD